MHLNSQEPTYPSDLDLLDHDFLREILISLQEEFCSTGDFMIVGGALYINNHIDRMWLN